MKVNICGKKTDLTQEELNIYLEKYPQYKEQYYIIS